MIINRKIVGGGISTDIVSNMSSFSFRNMTLQSDVDITCMNLSSGFQSIFRDANANNHNISLKIGKNISDINYICYELKNGNIITIDLTENITPLTAMQSTFFKCNCNTLTINYDFSTVVRFSETFRGCNIGTFVGTIDFSSATNIDYMFYASPNITSIAFAPNTLSISAPNTVFSFWTSLNDTTLVSLANCLKDGLTDKSIVLASTVKTRCNSIMGTVATVDNVNTFAADASGTVSLTDFITDYKEWTLA